MATIIDPKTRSALRKIGCLVEDQLDTTAFAKLLAQRLETSHIARDLDDVNAVETTIGQLVRNVAGRDDEQLLELVKPLLAAGAKAPVQQALSNGYLLCASRARIQVNINGEVKIVNIGTRFLSADYEVLDRYVLQPKQRRADSFVRTTLELTSLIEERQPDMAPRIGTFVEQLNITWQKALTA